MCVRECVYVLVHVCVGACICDVCERMFCINRRSCRFYR